MSAPKQPHSYSPFYRAILRFLEALLFGGFLSLTLILLAVVLYEGYHLQRIYPGVQALGVSLGGLTLPEAVVALPQAIDPHLAMPLRLRYRDQVWEVAAAQVGVRFDRPALVRLAHRVGRGHGLKKDLWQQLVAWQVGYEVGYQLTFDRVVANQLLAGLADQINRPVRDAALELRGLSIVTVPSQVGRRLDVDASRARIFALLGDLSGGEVDLVVHEIPPYLSDVSQAAQQVERILSGPITLSLPQDVLYEGTSPPAPWVISPELLAAALHIEQPGANPTDKLVVHLDETALRSPIALLAGELAVSPVDARLAYDPAANTFSELTPSRWGQELDVETTLERVLAAVESEQREIVLPLIPREPTVSAANAHNLGIQELVSEGITPFEGSSSARVQNIATAAARFHNVLVGPGEVFSFNEHLGEVSVETGYEESLIIMQDRTLVGIGGGVCQVATTCFRAILWGGYPVEERWAHGYRVRRYEEGPGGCIGLDATVYAPDVDLKFRNDTPYYLLIQTETDPQAQTVAFRFYSTSMGRRVEMEGPKIENRVPHGPDIEEEDSNLPVGTRKQVDWAKDGLDATVIRRVYEGQKLIREDLFFSRYQPWRARFRVGTKPPEE